jgi:hypothetical protein
MAFGSPPVVVCSNKFKLTPTHNKYMKLTKMYLLYIVEVDITATRFSLTWQYLDFTHLQILKFSSVYRSVTFVLIITVHLFTSQKLTTRNTALEFRNTGSGDIKISIRIKNERLH